MFWFSSEPIRLQEITYPDLVVARTENGKVEKAGSLVVFSWSPRFEEKARLPLECWRMLAEKV